MAAARPDEQERRSLAEVADTVTRARALVFDFDGTLVRSNEIKWRAFELTFGEFPERMDKIRAYCRDHHHTPRDVKFRHVWESVLGLVYTPEVTARLHARFDAATTLQIIAAPAVEGAERFLAEARPGLLTALLSSTPQPVLERIVLARGWRERFDAIQGAPVDKAAWLEGYRLQHRLGPGDVLMFGDSVEDAAAARAAGCQFVAIGDVTGARRAIRNFEELMGELGRVDASRR